MTQSPKTKQSSEASRRRDSQGTLTGALVQSDVASFGGYAYEGADLARRLTVEILVDGLVVKVARAEHYSPVLAEQNVGDACYGFGFKLTPELVRSANQVEIRLANVGTLIGRPLAAPFLASAGSDADIHGEVRWVAGLRLSGWIQPSSPGAAPIVRAAIDGKVVVETSANRWVHVTNPRGMAVCAFDVHLPVRFADGQVKQVWVTTEAGQSLAGNPVTLIAFEPGLSREDLQPDSDQRALLRGRHHETDGPQSLPFSAYQAELGPRHSMDIAPSSRSTVVVIVGQDGLEETRDSLEHQTQTNWSAICLPTGGDGSTFDPEDLSAALADHDPHVDHFFFLLSGTRLRADALARVLACFESHPETRLVYGDFDLTGADGASWLCALPAFDYERALEQGYLSYLFAVTRDAVTHAMNARADSLFRVANSVLDGGTDGAGAIRHIPGAIGVLPPLAGISGAVALETATTAHLEARNIDASVQRQTSALLPACRVTRRAMARTGVSIVIPVRNRGAMLRRCLTSLYPGASRVRAEVIVVDNDSSDGETREVLATVEREGVRVVRVPGPYNLSRLNRLGSEEARGDVLCFLSGGIEATDNGWLAELVSRNTDATVGAVGALQLWPTGVIRHGGFVLGVDFAAEAAFTDRMAGDPGYADLLRVAHECSSVSGAAMATRRDLFFELGGFDETYFPLHYYDVDYCLKLRHRGLRVVLTPHASLVRHDPVARWPEGDGGDDQRLSARELRVLRAKWGQALMADPYYSPLLGLDGAPFSSLAWPPRSLSARTNQSLPPAAIPPGI